MVYVPQRTNPTHEPNWLGLARTYGAFAAYRTIRDISATEKYFENTLQRSYVDEVLFDGPNFYWKLTETTNAFPANDETGNMNGVIQGPGSLTTVAGPLVGQDETGISTSTTPTSYITAPNGHAALDVSFPFTVEGWARTTQTRADPFLDIDGDTTYRIALSNGSTPLPSIRIDGINRLVINNGIGLDDAFPVGARYYDLGNGAGSFRYYNKNEWHHVVAVIDETEIKMYINGQFMETNAVSGNTAPADSVAQVKLTVGAHFSGIPHSDGEVSNFALYDYELPRDRVAAHYIAGSKTLDMEFSVHDGTIDSEGLGDHRPGPKVLWGDKFAQALILTPAAFTEFLEAAGDQFGRPEHDAANAGLGSFGCIIGLTMANAPDPTAGRALYDSRVLHTNIIGGGAVPYDWTTASGFLVMLDKDGNPHVDWMADNTPGHNLTGSGGDVSDGAYAFISVVGAADTGTPDNTTVSLMKNHEVVAQATAQEDMQAQDRVNRPVIIDNQPDFTLPVNGTHQGKFGPFILFANPDLTPEKVTQITRAIKGSDWPMRKRLSIRRPRRWHHLLGPSRP